MKSLSPVQSLILLALVGVALSGWFYGIHWKGVASGEGFTEGERLMIRLQDQITILTEENESLHRKIRELSGEEVQELPPSVVDPTDINETSVELPRKE